MGRISPGPTRWPPGAKRRLVPAKSNLKPQTASCVVLYVRRPGPPGSCSPVRVLVVCSSHASYPPPPSLLVLVHALLDCPLVFSCRRRLVLVALLAFGFESPSVLVRSFGLSYSSFPLAFVLLVPPTSPCSCLSMPPSCSLRTQPRMFQSAPTPDALVCSGPGSMCPSTSLFSSSPLSSRLLLFLLPLPVFSPSCPPPSVPCSCSCSPLRVAPPPSPSPCLLPQTCHSRAASSPDVPVRVRCLPGCSSPQHRVNPRTIQSGGLGLAPVCPGRSDPGRLFVVFSPLPRKLQSMAPGSPADNPVRGLGPCLIPPRMLQSGVSLCRILSVASDAPVRGKGSPPDDPVRGLVPCFVPPRMHQSGAFFCRILSVASDALVRCTGFSPGRCSPGARAVLHSAPDAPILGVFLSYSLRCLGRSSPWHRVHPRTIQYGG